VQEMQSLQESMSGRKNIRRVLKDKQVAKDTKLAAKEEEERLKRVAERQTLVCLTPVLQTFIYHKHVYFT